ncbi:hypothetical protein VIN01S_23160 [Vibrio inusitatus NBRC 102082]|uniref:Uncharacterized protein n=1 Tax=Vibrio inusitatus NBRC 102082 TaxID=1219070 RepID=A0A4Y3HXT8_9VIBR|nr:hypothetical protein VIN01S_23160 [Vibrio inusitatus NBRC 102082]
MEDSIQQKRFKQSRIATYYHAQETVVRIAQVKRAPNSIVYLAASLTDKYSKLNIECGKNYDLITPFSSRYRHQHYAIGLLYGR